MLYFKMASYLLRQASWRSLLCNSEKNLLRLWNKYSKKLQVVSHYESLKVIEDFKQKVPICSKEKIFENNSLRDLTRNKIQNIRFVMMSSGSSSKFSIGVFSKKEMKSAAFNTDLFLNLFFGAKKGKTFIINASSMGVRVFSNHVLSDTGPRTDIVIGLLKKVACYYDKVFIVGDPIFIKLMVEESILEGFDWDSCNAFFISGGEWLHETLRKYVHRITGKSPQQPEKGYWVGTYGLTELGYPLFFENAELVQLRSQRQCAIKKQNHSPNLPRVTTPFYFFFRANAYYLEELEQENDLPRMVFTPLDRSRLIPIFRYDTGDLGEIIRQPDFKLQLQPFPVVKFWGRDKLFIEIEKQKVYLNDIKEILFSMEELLPKITGFFKITKVGNKFYFKIQLKSTFSNASLTLDLEPFNLIYPNLIEAKAVPYHSMKDQMELDFERKFKTLN